MSAACESDGFALFTSGKTVFVLITVTSVCRCTFLTSDDEDCALTFLLSNADALEDCDDAASRLSELLLAANRLSELLLAAKLLDELPETD